MTARPRISLVMPNLNSGAVLERAIRTVLDQSYPDLQLILADAGSTDESRDVIERYRSHFDVVIDEPDAGQADGLNKGFRRADGDVFGWLCADDELMPGALEHVGHLFAEYARTDVVTGRCERIFDDGSRCITPADEHAWEHIIIRNTIEQPSTFWRSALHRAVGELDNSYYLSFDWLHWIRFRAAGARLRTTDAVLSRYHFTPDSKCNNAGNLFAEETYRLLSDHGPLNGRLARIFRHLYHRYDLRGCLDKPPSSSRLRYWCYRGTVAALRVTVGRRLIDQYNWHFASLQQRGMKWYDPSHY